MAELKYLFSKQFERTPTWIDKGSGATRDVGIWKPRPPAGYSCVGDTLGGYAGTSGSVLLVAVDQAGPGAPPLAGATYATQIWNDSGSGADEDGSLWLPSGPKGYVALGSIAAKGYERPSLNGYVVVREDLAKPGFWFEPAWTSEGFLQSWAASFWYVWAGQFGGIEPKTFGAANSFSRSPAKTLHTLSPTGATPATED